MSARQVVRDLRFVANDLGCAALQLGVGGLASGVSWLARRRQDAAASLEPAEHGFDGICPTSGPVCGHGPVSAAVPTPAADNPDCGCGSEHCPDKVQAALDEDTQAADGTQLFDSIVALWDYHRMTLTHPSGRGCEGCKWTGGSSRDHHLHRLSLVADMKAAEVRVQQQIGGAS